MSSPSAPKIMVIRHGEKPADNPPPHGVNANGDHDDQSLEVQGWQRAGALSPFLAPSFGPLQSSWLAVPQALFASGLSDSESERPVETITPLSQKTGLAIDQSLSKGQEAQVAQAAMAQQGVALICWQHDGIPAIANAILGNDTTAPQKWPGHRYDLVWVFDLQPGGAYAFTQVPQLLLAGDSPDPIT